jgi:hypothetical protein
MTNMHTKRDVTVHLGNIDEEYYNDSTLGHIKVRLDEIEKEAKDQGFDVVNARGRDPTSWDVFDGIKFIVTQESK